MTCGCKISRSDVVFTSNGYRCPKHFEARIEILEKECIDCGKILLLEPVSSTTQRCVECKLIHKRELQKKADSKRRDPNYKKKDDRVNQEKIKASIDAWNCKERDNCLSKSLLFNHCAKFLPCYECKEYKSLGVAL